MKGLGAHHGCELDGGGEGDGGILAADAEGLDKTVVNLSTVGVFYVEGSAGAEAYSMAKLTLCRLSEFLCAG